MSLVLMWNRTHKTHKVMGIADPRKVMKCSARLTFLLACCVFVTKAPTSRIRPLSSADIKYWWSYTSTQSRSVRVGSLKYYFELGASIFAALYCALFPAVEKGL
jgi:hypothetical protein